MTERDLGPYKFGCGIDMMLARQVARPADLQGRGGEVMGVNDGRRITNVVETYSTLNDEQSVGALNPERVLERDRLQAN